jgi:hypothetical protein
MIEGFMEAPVANAFGVLGAVCGAIWPLFRTRRSMLLVQSLIAAGISVHYILLGAYTGAMVNMLAGLQALAAIPLGHRPEFRKVYLLTLPLLAVGVAATWSGLPSVFAACGMALVSLGRYQIDTMRFRLLLFASIPFWMGHNALVWSVPGLISDALGAVFVSFTILRERRALRRPVAQAGE